MLNVHYCYSRIGRFYLLVVAQISDSYRTYFEIDGVVPFEEIEELIGDSTEITSQMIIDSEELFLIHKTRDFLQWNKKSNFNA